MFIYYNIISYLARFLLTRSIVMLIAMTLLTKFIKSKTKNCKYVNEFSGINYFLYAAFMINAVFLISCELTFLA